MENEKHVNVSIDTGKHWIKSNTPVSQILKNKSFILPQK